MLKQHKIQGKVSNESKIIYLKESVLMGIKLLKNFKKK